MIDGWNLLYYNAAYTESARTGRTFLEARYNLYKKYKSSLPVSKTDTFKIIDDSVIFREFLPIQYHKYSFDDINNPFYKSSLQKKVAIDYIKRNILIYTYVHIKGIINIYYETNAKTLANLIGFRKIKGSFVIKKIPGSLSEFKERILSRTLPILIITILISVYYLIIYSGFIAGCYALIKSKQYFIFTFLFSLVSYFAILAEPQGEARFKIPGLPFFLMISVFGIINLIRGLREK